MRQLVNSFPNCIWERTCARSSACVRDVLTSFPNAIWERGGRVGETCVHKTNWTHTKVSAILYHMRSRYRVVDPDGIYFLTSTIVQWLPALIGTDACGIIIDALRFCREHKGLRIYAYVIMENHIHLIAEAPELSRTLQSFKSHTARELIRHCEQTNKAWLLNQYAYFKKANKRTSNHQVWQEGTYPKLVQSDAMLQQKIAYIHENPVRRGWVDSPEHWRYSSARNYILGDNSVLEIDLLEQR